MVDLPLSYKPRVLYVDDEQDNLQSFKALFRREFEIRTALSAREALQILRDEKINVLVSDQRMPGMTGVELLERAAEEFPEVLRFMLTGFSDYDPLVDAINNGRIQGYFSKPLNPDEIKGRIRRGLENLYLKARNEQLFEELKISEERFRTLFEQAADSIVLVDPQTCMLHDFNAMTHTNLGYTRDDLKETRVYELAPETGREEMKRCLAKSLEKGTCTFTTQLRARDAGLRDFVMKFKAVSIRGQTYLLGILDDITEKVNLREKEKKLEAELRQLYKMEAIGTLAGGIAHDFNNILGIIMGNAEMALMDAHEESPKYKNMRKVMEAALRARDLVQQILVFSRRREYEKRPLGIVPLVKESLKLLRSSLPSTIEIRQALTVPFAEDSVLVDPTQIHQILMNLCTNASYAMRETGGILEIKYFSVDFESDDPTMPPELNPGSYVVLMVSDTGHGISPEVMDRIFEPYFTTKKQEEGTGLGLAVVHGIVKEHGGAIAVSSVPGKGSTFRIFFPKWHETATEFRQATPAPLQKGMESILLVDDEPALLEIVRRMLEQLGYSVVPKSSVLDALEEIRLRPDVFDLVITDQTMPKMTGLELSRHVTAARPDLPIILCTGFNDDLTLEKLTAVGVRALIIKPVAMNDIAGTIRKVLDGETLV